MREAIKPEATHLLLSYKSQKITMLFRASDGVALGQQKGETVVFGEEPNKKTSRVFFDQGFAEEFLKSLALWDMQARRNKTTLVAEVNGSAGLTIDASVEIQAFDGEGLIIMPDDTMDFAKPGDRPRPMKH